MAAPCCTSARMASAGLRREGITATAGTAAGGPSLDGGRRLDQLERGPIRGHEGLILGDMFRDFRLAMGPVVEAGEIPEQRGVVSRFGGAIKREIGRLPSFVGHH